MDIQWKLFNLGEPLDIVYYLRQLAFILLALWGLSLTFQRTKRTIFAACQLALIKCQHGRLQCLSCAGLMWRLQGLHQPQRHVPTAIVHIWSGAVTGLPARNQRSKPMNLNLAPPLLWGEDFANLLLSNSCCKQ